ncbi:MAG: hypothetical protein EA384_09080 [Spirochaetaceae bacterium]|nr:MAG: hypothetical protein EA384_09080 [Spirochaetaceae bacterium]
MAQRRTVPILVLFLMPAVAATLHAELSAPPVNVVQDYRPQTETDTSLERVLHAAMAVGLSRAGPLNADTQPAPGHLRNRSQLLEYAAGQDASLLLLGSYRLVGEQVAVRFELIDVAEGTLLATSAVTREIDLLVDRLADIAAADLYNQAAERIAVLAAERARVAQQRRRTDEAREADRPPPEAAPAPEAVLQPQPAPPRPAGLEPAVAAGVALPIGGFADHFGPGISADLSLHVQFDRLAVGLVTGVVRFSPDRQQTGEYVRTLLPVLVDVRVAVAQRGTLAWIAHVSGGAALRLHDGSSVSERLAPALPAWRSGFGLRIPLRGSLTLSPGVVLNGMLHLYRVQDGAPVKVEHILNLTPMLALAWIM